MKKLTNQDKECRGMFCKPNNSQNPSLQCLLGVKHYLLLRRSYDAAKKFATLNPAGVRAPACGRPCLTAEEK